MEAGLQHSGATVGTRNFENRTMYHGNNLPVLQGMNSETVDLIATDPPFNKGKDFHATPESLAAGAKFEDRWTWDADVEQEWVDAIQDNWPGAWAVIEAARRASGDDMGAYLCWLGVRLMEMHRILKPTGSLYLHLDHTAGAWGKALLDAIFGRRNFRNEIIWCYTTPSNTLRWFPRKHDTILFYTKGEKWVFNVDEVRTPYKRGSKLDGKGWGVRSESYSQDEVTKGKVIPSWWADCTPVQRLLKERTGYPTQKPLALYERIIKASSNEGDMVLDPFAGCATTPVAAERQSRQWVAIDRWEGAIKQVEARLEQNKQLLRDPNPRVLYTTEPPIRTDANEIAAPNLRIQLKRAREPWEKLSHAQMRMVLEGAQASASEGLVMCAGCGRDLESEFMELDHLHPKDDNGPDHLLNRILLCRPCNGRKSNQLTMAGLRRQNRKAGWMKDASRSEYAQRRAVARTTWVSENWEHRREVGLE